MPTTVDQPSRAVLCVSLIENCIFCIYGLIPKILPIDPGHPSVTCPGIWSLSPPEVSRTQNPSNLVSVMLNESNISAVRLFHYLCLFRTKTRTYSFL